MSRYEWERGEIRTAFKRELQSTFTALMDRQYELARALYEHLRKAGKGKRKFDYLREAQEWAYAQRPRLGEYDAESASAVIDAVLKVDEHGRSRLRSPKKKDFRVRRNVLDFWHPLLYWDARLVLDEKTRTVRWVVPENNRAVDFAWRHPMGKAFENALRKVRWVRGTGGKLVGNDEYNCDSRYEGGGANYVTRRYGPLGQA